ncbi:MAG TPA: ATP-grasp domain-containing protein [Pirellulales bacterium]|jgi:predicted ATP-grasp superfamily ATP-dependent carboligase|nr:ATP-grasp domain-containing protein [Pirellulales bacterium]
MQPPERSPPPIVIVGASVRAAAFSAMRAGYAPRCVDLFADADLKARCSTIAVNRYPADLFAAARKIPAADWLYTGGLENYPTSIDRLAERGLLLGNRGAVLRRVRDPHELSRRLTAHGFAVPQCAAYADGLPCNGSWLVKRRGASGGMHVRPWLGQVLDGGATRYVWQQRIDGDPLAAVYVGAAGRAVLLGVTQQLLAGARRPAAPFTYAGSRGPLRLGRVLEAQFVRLGQGLAAEFMLEGLFGVDVIAQGDAIWPIEVNPRYTASIELLERWLQHPAISWHVAACRGGTLPHVKLIAAQPVYEKQILIARRSLEFDAATTSWLFDCNHDLRWPRVADIPSPGARINPGEPVMTVFADGSDQVQSSAVVAQINERLGENACW